MIAPAETSAPKLLLTADEAAEALSVCRKTLWAWTAPRGPIPSVKIGASVRYSVASLKSFIANQEKREAKT